jgi:hypothetical protein
MEYVFFINFVAICNDQIVDFIDDRIYIKFTDIN